MASSADPVLQARDLEKRYPNGTLGLAGLNLTVGHGEIVGLLGRSGSGKTTLFRSIVGTIRPTGGELNVLGANVRQVRPAQLRRLRARIGWVAQQHNLVPELSAAQNVLLGTLGHAPIWRTFRRLLHLSRAERQSAFKALEQLGLGERLFDRADNLSGGQQQRIAVARALIGNPELVLADEPVASVDARTAEDVLHALVAHRDARGATVMVSLHQPELALRYCTRIVVLRGGRVDVDAPPSKIDPALLYAETNTQPRSSPEGDSSRPSTRERHHGGIEPAPLSPHL
ncbi:MAG: ATP-binding cassette domain-containing protein [Chloroflexota bacterium]